jgi:hypothetical protein
VSLRVELFERIRRDRRLEPQVTQRELMRRYGVGRRTVVQALAAAVPPPRREPEQRRASLLDPAKGWIDEMLRADLSAPRKQRHTAQRVYDRLRTEHGFDRACYATVRKYVRRRRGEIVAEARDGHRHMEGTVPQLHLPAAEAEVDFAEVWVRLAGEPIQCSLFTLRLSCSGKAVHRVFATQGQEAFLEGHVEALRVLGGVPWRHIRYDNLRAAVRRVCFGRSRVESQRWVAFRSHYGFDAFYCLPGQEGAHEKGGVEHEGGRFRRTHLVPVPEVDTLAELNERLAAIDAAEDGRHIDGNPISVGVNFAAEVDALRPLPDDEFDCGVTLTPLVRSNSRIVVRQSNYSVPARFIGRTMRVSLRANDLVVFDRNQVVARHPRLTRRRGYRDDLDHFLEILLVKPGALAGSTALAQARTEGSFTALHDAFWSAARAAHGDAAGTRALIEVLLLHRRMSANAVAAGITAALDVGVASPELVTIEARKADRDHRLDAEADAASACAPTSSDGDADMPGGIPADHGSQVISLAGRRAASVADSRPLPSLAVYDQLLTRPWKGTA